MKKKSTFLAWDFVVTLLQFGILSFGFDINMDLLLLCRRRRGSSGGVGGPLLVMVVVGVTRVSVMPCRGRVLVVVILLFQMLMGPLLLRILLVLYLLLNVVMLCLLLVLLVPAIVSLLKKMKYLELRWPKLHQSQKTFRDTSPTRVFCQIVEKNTLKHPKNWCLGSAKSYPV